MAESEFDIIDDPFRLLVKTSASVERIWTGGRWTEGPVYFPALRSLLWSDIPNDRIMRWDECTGETGVFRGNHGHYSNGHTVDRQGRLISCEHGTRRVTRTEHDGSITVLADSYDGKRLNSPNDVVVRSDNSIWFTDPAYGIDSDYEGFAAPQEQAGDYVFRLDPDSGALSVVADDFQRPNGLAFSVDEQTLYIADSGFTRYKNGNRHIRKFAVGADGTLSGGEVVMTCETGIYDGFRLDTEGRIWTSAGNGVECYLPDGNLIGRIKIPERVANLVFGGPKRNRMFIAGTSSIYAIMLPVTGAKTF
ncbi:MAG: SMP-30/gluconolactonase/LRE family protein [Thalassobaculaceae bacterium]|nr:SMP-30/gluconolactonase/LRE family protein [Thalassobaculaceae bacterium]